MKKSIQFLLILLTGAFLTACGATDADKIGEAQACLDKATTTAQANVCTAKVSGIQTAAANGIRCSGNFIAEGFGSASKIVSLLQGLESGGIDALLGLLTFTSKGNINSDNENASETFQYCLNSGGKGSTLLMAFSNVTMAVYSFAANNASAPVNCPLAPSGGVYPFENCLQSGMNPLAAIDLGDSGSINAGTIATQTAIGNTIIATNALSCASGTGANQQMCAFFSDAIDNAGGTSNPRAVAREFILTIFSAIGI